MVTSPLNRDIGLSGRPTPSIYHQEKKVKTKEESFTGIKLRNRTR